jgi:hypothetical protein
MRYELYQHTKSQPLSDTELPQFVGKYYPSLLIGGDEMHQSDDASVADEENIKGELLSHVKKLVSQSKQSSSLAKAVEDIGVPLTEVSSPHDVQSM